MPKMERIFIRIDSETGAVLRKWFTSKGTTLAGAISAFLMDEYAKCEAAGLVEPDEGEVDEPDVEVEACPLKPAEADGGEA